MYHYNGQLVSPNRSAAAPPSTLLVILQSGVKILTSRLHFDVKVAVRQEKNSFTAPKYVGAVVLLVEYCGAVVLLCGWCGSSPPDQTSGSDGPSSADRHLTLVESDDQTLVCHVQRSGERQSH